MDHDFDSAIIDDVAHRPWDMPSAPWVLTQTWHDLLFAHWRVDPRLLTAKVPADLPLDLYDGCAWIAVVPFRMTNVAPRGVPALPWVSEFPELNVRTYVKLGNRPGVYFFSLDAGSALAVQAARALLNLPYFTATMTVARTGDAIEYTSRRDSDQDATFAAVYEPIGPAVAPAPGSLEYFLTERYCLYHRHHLGGPYRLEIHHPPWPLQPARARITRNTMAQASGLVLPDEPPLLHFVKRQDVVAWAPVGIGDR